MGRGARRPKLRPQSSVPLHISSVSYESHCQCAVVASERAAPCQSASNGPIVARLVYPHVSGIQLQLNNEIIQDCCRTGFRWDGQPTGKETRIDGLDVYVAGDIKKNAILFCHDAFGGKLNNNRVLADHFAQEIGATVYMPDFFHSDPVAENAMSPDTAPFDWSTWLTKHNPQTLMSEILTIAQHLRSQYTKLGEVGYCWGGKVAILLGSTQHPGLVDCISLAHPSLLTEDDIRSVNVPIQIIVPEIDPAFTPELKKFCNEEIPKLGVDYDYQYFPGAKHGFATRCNVDDEKERKALERAENAAVYFPIAPRDDHDEHCLSNISSAARHST